MNKCYVIGNPIEQSRSPLIHNAAYRELGLDYEFLKEKLEFSEISSKILSLKNDKSIKGISVTMPFKQEVIKYLDLETDEAKAIGAVNTIYIENDKIVGTNTDWYGVYQPIANLNIELSNKDALVFGGGGAARSAIYALKKLGAKVFIYARNADKAYSLASEFSSKVAQIDNANSYSIAINATPLGMYPNVNEYSIAENIIDNSEVVFDLVYNPLMTRSLAYAKDKGKSVIFGTEMFVYQAVKQFELYTGEKAPVDVMREALYKDLDNNE